MLGSQNLKMSQGFNKGRNSSPSRHQAPVCNTQNKVLSTPVMYLLFKVLRNELLRYMLHTCPNCDVTCAQSATQWTASIHTLHTLHTSRNLGWGGVCNDMHCTCTHIRCYAIALAHMFDATQLHFLTCSMLRNCICAHVRCYAIALAHMFDATQLHLGTRSMLRNCTWAHVRCYAIALGHMFDATQLHLGTCSMLRNCPCAHVGCYAIAFAHIP